MKRVIYTVTDISQDCNDLYSRIKKITLPTFYNYATKYNLDVIQIKNRDYINFEYDSRIKDKKSKIYHLFFYVLDLFLKSDYDEMLFLDIDIFIEDNSPNIFNLLTPEPNNFHIKFYDLPGGQFDKDCSYDMKLHLYSVRNFYKQFLGLIIKYFYCTGLVLCNKQTLEIFSEVMPRNWAEHTNILVNTCYEKIKASKFNYAFTEERIHLNYCWDYFLRDSNQLRDAKYNPLLLFNNEQYINNMDHYQLTTVQSLYNSSLDFTPLNTNLWNSHINKESKVKNSSYFKHFAGETSKNILFKYYSV